MEIFSSTVLDFLISIIVFIFSALPLHLAVKFFRGRTNLIKTAFVTFITGIIVSAIKLKFETFGWIISFIILIWIYSLVFKMGMIRSFFAWLLQFVFIALFYLLGILLAGLFLGISLAPFI